MLMSSSTSAALVTRVVAPVRISWGTPAEVSLVNGPGTPINGLRNRVVQFAVLSAPDLIAASTTTVPIDNPAMTRFLDRNRWRIGEPPSESSETTAPCTPLQRFMFWWRSVEGCIGKACVTTCGLWWSPTHNHIHKDYNSSLTIH